MPKYDVVVKTVPAMLVADAACFRSPRTTRSHGNLGPAFTEAYEYVRKQGAKDTGPCFALWHSPADVTEMRMRKQSFRLTVR